MACKCNKVRHLQKKMAPISNSSKDIYLDYAASTPVDLKCLAEFEKICRTIPGNPSSFHPAGIRAAEILEEARETFATFFNCNEKSVFFCGSATEALNTLILGCRNHQCITTNIEHATIIRPLNRLAESKKTSVSYTKLLPNGQIDINNLGDICSRLTKPVFIYSPINHETGILQDYKSIYETVSNKGGLVIMDAVQIISRIPRKEWTSYADAFCATSHKLYSPAGSSVICLRKPIPIKPARFGGHQERSLFPGTQNLACIHAFSYALSLINTNDNLEYSKSLGKDFIRLLETEIKGIVFNTPKDSCCGILNISLPFVSSITKLLLFLSQHQISVSRFSACTNDIRQPSEILSKIGLSKEISSKSIRISWGRFTSRDDIRQFIKILQKFIGGFNESI